MVKRVVKVYLSEVQKKMLDYICSGLGWDQSGFFEAQLMKYAKDINLVKETVHSGQTIPNRP